MIFSDLIIGMGLIFGGASAIDNSYIDVGYAIHSTRLDSPEVNLDASIFEIETGIEFGRTKIFFRHNSGIQTHETGGGFNLVGAKYRIK